MTRRKTGFTLEQHVQHARAVRAMRKMISSLLIEATRAYRSDSRLLDRVRRLDKVFIGVQSTLEDALFKDFPHVRGFPHYGDDDLRELVRLAYGDAVVPMPAGRVLLRSFP